MLNYCRSADGKIGGTFECRTFNKCEDVEDRFHRRQCIKELCEEDEFADTCLCKRRRGERKKCFRQIEEEEDEEV